MIIHQASWHSRLEQFFLCQIVQTKAAVQSNTGQTLVVMLLILVVTLTVGLSVVTRTITNVQESATSQRSTRAFDAAEAGIENALRADLSTLPANSSISIGSASSSATANVTIAQTGGSTPYQPVKAVAKDDVLQLNLSGTTANSVQVEWSLSDPSAGEHQSCNNPNGPFDAALEIAFYTVANSGANVSDYGITRYAYNPYGCLISGTTQFLSASSDTPTFDNTVTLAIPANGKILRIRPLFNAATLRISPIGGNLPAQSYVITSEGIAGDTKRVVKVEKTIGGLPSIFDYVLFNGCPSSGTCPQLTHN